MSRPVPAPTGCTYRVRRGGPSEGASYDRLNFTRYGSCGAPLAEGDKLFCRRHRRIENRSLARDRARQVDLDRAR